MPRLETLDLSRKFDYPIRLLVIGDTHYGARFHPDKGFCDLLAAVKSDLLLHTGDLYSPQAYDFFKIITEFHAVRGNRDLLLWHKLPGILFLKFQNLKICLFHGQGNLLSYLKLKKMALNRDQAVFSQRFTFPPESRSADLLITGHTHSSACVIENEQVILNPGAAVHNARQFGFSYPSFALLTLETPVLSSVEFFHQKMGVWHEPCRLIVDRSKSSVREA